MINLMSLAISNELRGWIETIKDITKVESTLEDMLVAVKEILLVLWEDDRIDEDEYLNVVIECNTILYEEEIENGVLLA